jgi:hypothetical protein
VRPWIVLVLAALPGAAHNFSASRSELTLEGNGLARLEVHLPLTEVEHLAQANRALLRHFRINNEGAISQQCEYLPDELVCRGKFFATEPLEIECRLPEAVLPQHIHSMKFQDQTIVFTGAIVRAVPGQRPPLVLFVVLAVALLAAAVVGSRWLRRRRISVANSTVAAP